MSFLQAGRSHEPMLRAPAAVLWLLGLLIAAHALRVLASAAVSDRIMIDYALIPARYAADAGEPGTLFEQVVPFFSYMFVHADWTHLGFNCLWLLAFGSVVARRFRAALFFLFFLVCGLGAAATYVVLNPHSPAAVVGASGAISGLMAAGIRMLNIAMSRPREDRAGLIPLWSPLVLTFSLFWVAVNLAFGLTGISIAGETHAIAWEAHLGGYFVGLLLSGPFDMLSRRGVESDLEAS